MYLLCQISTHMQSTCYFPHQSFRPLKHTTTKILYVCQATPSQNTRVRSGHDDKVNEVRRRVFKESVRGTRLGGEGEREADLERFGSVMVVEFKVWVMLVLSRLVKPQELNMCSYFPVSLCERERKTERECARWRKQWWHLAVLLKLTVFFLWLRLREETVSATAMTRRMCTQIKHISSNLLQVNLVWIRTEMYENSCVNVL